jgi:alkanesulfonate monooxygenase SsuD/methylene tetrahydromethanopterin reductase-like flavin-dependent oxidoreductase (luciferase family)
LRTGGRSGGRMTLLYARPMVRPLAVGVQLPEAEREAPWSEYVSMARAAEEVGFDSVWLGDHLLYRDPGDPERGPWDAWTMLAGLAAVTERVRLGPLVACLAFHPPGILARMAATVNQIAGERFTLGVGAGWNEPEFRAFGLPFDRLASRFEESFDVVRRLLAGERVTAHGAYVEVEDAVLYPTLATPPRLMIGSTGERVLRASLPYVDAWNVWGPWCGNDPDGFAAASADVGRIAADLGRDPAEVERSICVYAEVDVAPGERAFEEDAPPLTGGAAGIAAGLRAFAEAGADEAILVLNVVTERSIRTLGDVLADLDT